MIDTKAPHRAAGDVVGVNGPGLNIDIRKVISPGRMPRSPFQDFSTQRSIGAGITDDPGRQPGQHAVFIASQRILHVKGVAFGVHADGFRSIQPELDRFLQMEAKNGGMPLNG